MTTLDYLIDNYQKTSYSRVIDTDIASGAILLDHTPVHPQGGHQASDKAVIYFDGEQYEVKEAKNKEGSVWHYLNEPKAASLILPGMDVQISVDWKRRLELMRLHTCQHLVSALAFQLFGFETIDLAIEEQGCSLKFQRAITPTEVIAIEKTMLAVIADDLVVQRINENGRYLVKIGEVDQRYCGCTHVRSLSEIRHFRVIWLKGERVFFVAGTTAADAMTERQAAWLAVQHEFPDKINDLRGYVDIVRANIAKLDEYKKMVATQGLALLNFELLQRPVYKGIRVVDRPELTIHQVRAVISPYLRNKKQLVVVRCMNSTIVVFSSLICRPAGNVIGILKVRDEHFKGGGGDQFAQGGPWTASLEGLERVIQSAFLEVSAYCD